MEVLPEVLPVVVGELVLDGEPALHGVPVAVAEVCEAVVDVPGAEVVVVVVLVAGRPTVGDPADVEVELPVVLPVEPEVAVPEQAVVPDVAEPVVALAPVIDTAFEELVIADAPVAGLRPAPPALGLW